MKDLELVYAVYKYGSFTKAAEELYIGQSSLSMAIQRIEGELGLPLFDRRQHPVKLTSAGEEVIRYYLEVKPLQARMQARVQDIAELRSGSFAIGGSHYLLSYILPECLVRFAQQYPGVELRIIEAQSSQFKELLTRCDIDLCLMCDVADPNLQPVCHAFFDELYLAVPKQQVAALGLAESPLTAEQLQNPDGPEFDHYFRTEDLDKITFLQLTSGNNLYSRSEEIFRQLGARPRKVVHLQQFATACNLAGSGLGCTLTSSRLITRQSHPNLVYYKLPSPLMIRDFHFTARKGAYLSRSMRAFCELFAELEQQRQKAPGR